MLVRSLFVWSCVIYTALFHVVMATGIVTENQVGAAQLHRYLPMLANKRVGLVVNQTSKVADKHLVDVLVANGVNVQVIFAPEHGFRGDHDAGQLVDSTIDQATGIAIVSIYGKHKRPSADIMDKLDVLIFDIQDVGVRFYTYISSMHYMMQAAALRGIPFIVLDRPNPNIQFVDGPVLEAPFRSFVGMHPIPVLHGLTVGELAKMIIGENWLAIDAIQTIPSTWNKLTVVPVANYQRTDAYTLPVAPSPNLPNQKAIERYPSLCWFEPTPVSIGRGTDFPFQVLGHDQIKLGEFHFQPRPIIGAARDPKLNGKQAFGLDLRAVAVEGLELTYLLSVHQQFVKHHTEFFQSPDFFDKLAGTDKLRLAILAGQSSADIKASWQEDLIKFKTTRQPYLLYPH